MAHAPCDDHTSPTNELATLRQRVTELEQENITLQAELAHHAHAHVLEQQQVPAFQPSARKHRCEDAPTWQAMLEASRDGMMVISSDGSMVTVNQRFKDLWRVPDDWGDWPTCAEQYNYLVSQVQNADAFIQCLRPLDSVANNDEAHDLVTLKDGRTLECYSSAYGVGETVAGRIWSFRDVTDIKRAEEALHDNRALLQGLLDYAPASIVVKDAQGKTLLANQQFASLFGLNPAQVVDMPDEALLPPEVYQEWRRQEQQIIATAAPLTCEEYAHLADGLHTYLSVKFPLYNAQGHIYAVGGICTDITERVRTEAALRASQTNLQTLFDKLEDFLFIVDTQQRILKTNPVVERRLGYTAAELHQMPVIHLHPPEQREEAAAIVNAMLVGETDLCAVPLMARDGTHIPVETRVSHGTWNDQPVLFGISRDNTQRKQAAEALRMFKALVDNAVDGIGVTTLDGTIIYANPTYQDMMGYGEELVGSKLIDTYNEDPKHLMDLVQYVTRHGSWQGDLSYRRKDGSIFPGQLSALTICDDTGKPQAVAGIIRNVTDQRHLEEALRYRVAFTQVITSISTRFITTKTDEIDHEILRALHTIGMFAHADRMFVSLFNEDCTQVNFPYQWAADTVGPLTDLPPCLSVQPFTWISKQFFDTGVVAIANVADMPPEARAEQEYFQSVGVRSFLAVSMNYAGTVIGSLSFTILRGEREWSADIIDLLKVVGEIFTNALQRKKAETALQQAHEELEGKVARRTADLTEANQQLEHWLARLEQANTALLHSEARSRALLLAMPDSMLLFNRDGIILDFKTGHSVDLFAIPDRMIGSRISDVLPANLDTLCCSSARHVFETGEMQIFEYHVPTTAHVLDYEVRLVLCGTDQILAVVRNVTERKQAERALVESEKRYRSLVETSPGAILLTELDGTICFCNQQAAKIFGYTSVDDLCGINGADLIVFDYTADNPLEQVQRIIDSGNLRNIDYIMRRNNGQQFPAEVSSSVVTDSHGYPTALIVVVRDMTAYKQAEQQLTSAYTSLAELNAHLSRSRDLLRAIFDGLEDGLLLLDGTGYIQTVNRAMAALLGSTPDMLVGQHWARLSQRIAPDFPDHMVLNPRQESHIRYQRRRHRAPDGSIRILEPQTIALYGASQTVEQIIVHVADVTETVQLQARVLENERLAASGRLAASVAHEINTPLQSIQTFLELASIATEEDRNTFLNHAIEETQRAGRIVRQLLDLHRPHAVVSSELVDTNALLERLLLLLGKRLRDQGITIERDLNPDLPLIRGRSDDLTQVFLNLLVNAIEATPNGGTIRVHTLVNQENTPQEEVIATISDTGSGISPDLQARIFEPFVTTKASSTGLGLSISIQIIRQHHGTVTITSEPGQGSTFMVSLPGATAVSGEGS